MCIYICMKRRHCYRSTLFERFCIVSKYKIRALCSMHCAYDRRCEKNLFKQNRAHTTKTYWDVVVLIKFTVWPFKRPLRRVEQYLFATVLWPITLKHLPPVVYERSLPPRKAFCIEIYIYTRNFFFLDTYFSHYTHTHTRTHMHVSCTSDRVTKRIHIKIENRCTCIYVKVCVWWTILQFCN